MRGGGRDNDSHGSIRSDLSLGQHKWGLTWPCARHDIAHIDGGDGGVVELDAGQEALEVAVRVWPSTDDVACGGVAGSVDDVPPADDGAVEVNNQLFAVVNDGNVVPLCVRHRDRKGTILVDNVVHVVRVSSLIVCGLGVTGAGDLERKRLRTRIRREIGLQAPTSTR